MKNQCTPAVFTLLISNSSLCVAFVCPLFWKRNIITLAKMVSFWAKLAEVLCAGSSGFLLELCNLFLRDRWFKSCNFACIFAEMEKRKTVISAVCSLIFPSHKDKFKSIQAGSSWHFGGLFQYKLFCTDVSSSSSHSYLFLVSVQHTNNPLSAAQE